jgi:hypothetical protein
MKNIIFTLILLTLGFNTGNSQNYNWITPNQTYLKMFIAEDGMYRIDKNDFVNAGISTTGIDPRTVKVYYKGNQIRIYFQGEQDGVFDENDYFDFYGQRNYGGLTNTYDVNGNLAYITDEYYNIYSDTSAYFIGWGGSYGTRYIDYNYQVSTPYPLNYFKAKVHFETEALYWLGETTSGQDYRYFLNDKFQGEGWYWRAMANNNTQSNTVNLPYCQPNADMFEFKIFAYPTTNSSAVFNEHRMMVRINNNLIDTIKRDDFNRMDTTYSFPGTYFLTGNNTVLLKFTPPSTFTSARMYLDMFSITYPRRFAFDSNKISIYNLNGDTATRLFSVSGFVPANELTIYDYVNGYRITNINYTNDILNFSGKSNGKYEITNKPITKKPKRIKQRQVPNLVTNSTGVDYLVVYNKLFEAQAEQLRQYRSTHDNYRTYKAEIEDIYDIFNYGIEDPVALKRFSKQVYQFWQAPKIKYLTLFGRGSLDPKKILASSTYYNNYVPVYGNPTTDGYFVNFNENTTTYYQQISVGRLPCYTSQEAQDVITKIISYDNAPLDDWIKKSLVIAGGYDKNDQSNNVNQGNHLINNYLNVPPNSFNPVRIYLNDTSGLVTYNYQDSIVNSINTGAVIVNYTGHSGNGYWDFSFDDPNILENDKYPMVFSMTCFTGKTAEANSRGYGEKFVYYPNKGAISFISTTGWSWSSSGNIFNEWCLKGIKLDTLRLAGEIVKYASTAMAPDSVSFPVRNTINCYSLIGDPATKLILPKYPEYQMTLNDYEQLNPNPFLNENVNISVYLRNLGLFSDSMKTRFILYKNNIVYKTQDIITRSFGFLDTLNINYKLDSIGIYKVRVQLDPDNWNTKENKNNNIIEFPINFSNTMFYPISPMNHQKIITDTVIFSGINPTLLNNHSTQVILQIDTNIYFNSPLLQTHFKNNPTGVKSEFKIKLSPNNSESVYFWRTRTIINQDTSVWSQLRTFRLENPKYQSKHENYFDSLVTIFKYNKDQFQNDEKSFINTENFNLKIGYTKGYLYSRSQTIFTWSPSMVTIGNNNFQLLNAGLYLYKISRTNGFIRDSKYFPMNNVSYNDSVINYINTFDTTSFLLACKAFAISGGITMSNDAKNMFRMFGSTYVDSVGSFGWYSTWSFLGKLNYTPQTVKEKYIYYPGGGSDANPSIILSEPDFLSNFGVLKIKNDVSQYYKSFQWEQQLFPQTSIKFDVIGVKRDNTEQVLYQNLTNNNLVNLDTINAYTYPNLKLVAKLSIDTSGGMMLDNIPYGGIPSPILKSITFNYVPPCELAIDYSLMIRSDSIMSDKDSLGISFQYYNVGFKNCYGSVVNTYILRENVKILLQSDTNYSTIKIDSMKFFKKYINFGKYLPPIRKKDEYISVFAEILPLGQQNDLYYFNNTINTDVLVKSTVTQGTFDLFADGIKILGGEYVKRNPEISVKYSGKDGNPINFSDTSLFKILINNILYQFNSPVSKPVTQSDVVNKNKVTRGEQNDANRKQVEIKNSFVIYPELQEGENEIKILTRVSYETGFDSVKYNVLVSNEFFVKDFYNYPNPMNSETVFMFTLAGNSVFDCKLKIYTVSGKLIKTIDAPVNIGYNQVRWDGRDNDGEVIANGVYLYKLIVEGDGKKETPVQKLVVLK